MKITHNKVGQNLNTSDTKSGKAGSASKANDVKNSSKTSETSSSNHAGGPSHATRVELSQRVKDIKRIQEMAKNAPDVDAEKVAKFKQMIADGTYKVDAKAVADRMVDDALKTAGTE